MATQQEIDYQRIEKAIAFIQSNFKRQPSLEEVAAAIHTSPYHFQRLFKEWAGVSPKKFNQFLSLQYAKNLLKTQRLSLMDAAHETGLSGTGRLHDLFVTIDAVTPGEYKDGGADLTVNYCFADSPFGKVIVASTSRGICYMSFDDKEETAIAGLTQQFPNARHVQIADEFQQQALFVFQRDWQQLAQIKLHLLGTPFQLKVWESLLRIPAGGLSTYGDIARYIEQPGASRAVGTAIGANPVAFLIPCHRVIKHNGQAGGYKWGSVRKSAMIGWEAAKEGPALEA